MSLQPITLYNMLIWYISQYIEALTRKIHVLLSSDWRMYHVASMSKYITEKDICRKLHMGSNNAKCEKRQKQLSSFLKIITIQVNVKKNALSRSKETDNKYFFFQVVLKTKMISLAMLLNSTKSTYGIINPKLSSFRLL